MERGASAATASGDQKQVLVVGAGPVGALAAIFLRRQGYVVRVYEKREDPRHSDGRGGRSINLALANRGIDALSRAGVMDRIWPLLIPMRGRMVHPLTGEHQLQPYGRGEEEVIYSVSRHALNVALIDVLAEAAVTDPEAVTLHFGYRCASVDLPSGVAVFESEQSQSTVEFDHIIGADGAGSVVRQAIQDQLSADKASESAGAAAVPSSHMLPLGHGYKELTIPATSAGAPALMLEALHIWPRGNHMMIALPNQDASFTVTLFLPLTGTDSFEALEDPTARAQFLQQHYADALAFMPDWQTEFEENPVGQLATLQCWPWHYRDRALLIGDAAHAIVPFHGQGMNCGFEDCAVLDACLQGAEGSNDWLGLCEAFVTERKPNCDAIARMAIENYEEMRASVVDPVFLLKKAVGLELQRRFPDRFTPRYSMVMFGRLPYKAALDIGIENEKILNALVKDKRSIDEIDWAFAAQLLERSQKPASAKDAVPLQ